MFDNISNYIEQFSLVLFYIGFFGLSEVYVKSAKLTKTQQILYYFCILFLAFILMYSIDIC